MDVHRPDRKIRRARAALHQLSRPRRISPPRSTAATMPRWLRALPDDAALSLYLHVPFCARLCLFCGCHTTRCAGRSRWTPTPTTLLAEIDLLAAAIGRRLAVRHVHWGGGTPTRPAAGADGGGHAAPARALRVRPDAEVAVEIDPRTPTRRSLDGAGGDGHHPRQPRRAGFRSRGAAARSTASSPSRPPRPARSGCAASASARSTST